MTGLSALRSSIEVRPPVWTSPTPLAPLAPPPSPAHAPTPPTHLAPQPRTHQRRIDELDDFYHENLVDERCVLFNKQCKKLRQLLNEYAAAVAAHSAAAPLGSSAAMGLEESRVSQGGGGQQAFGASAGGGGGGSAAAAAAAAAALGAASIIIRPDQRLSYEHLSWWFAQEGARELPGMDQAIVERVWGHVTRTNLDGRMSVSDLKGWYISFGKRALARHPPLTAADLEHELVPTAFMYDSRASVSERVERAQAERERLEALRLEKLKEIGRAEAARAGGGGGARSSGSGSASGGGGGGGGAGARFLAAPTGAPSLALPSDAFDFQLRLTEEEYRSMRLRQRELLATAKFRERIEAAHAKAPAREGSEAELGIYTKSEGAFVDAGKRNAILYRS
jgi:hypothetical protein